MVALAPKYDDPDAMPFGEEMVKLCDAGEYIPYCKRTIKKLADSGYLETWDLGLSVVTTKEACYRAAKRRQPVGEMQKPTRRIASNRAKDSVGRFLALK